MAVATTSDPMQAVSDERNRQEAKWGVQRHDMTVWLTVLSEEVGETAQAILKYRELASDKRLAVIRAEAVQVAAVAVAMVEHLDGIANAPYT